MIPHHQCHGKAPNHIYISCVVIPMSAVHIVRLHEIPSAPGSSSATMPELNLRAVLSRWWSSSAHQPRGLFGFPQNVSFETICSFVQPYSRAKASCGLGNLKPPHRIVVGQPCCSESIESAQVVHVLNILSSSTTTRLLERTVPTNFRLNPSCFWSNEDSRMYRSWAFVPPTCRSVPPHI
jgi:hypothetical protein